MGLILSSRLSLKRLTVDSAAQISEMVARMTSLLLLLSLVATALSLPAPAPAPEPEPELEPEPAPESEPEPEGESTSPTVPVTEKSQVNCGKHYADNCGECLPDHKVSDPQD